ncbi:DNA-binding protein [Acinetobacter haemolyticus]|uniref:DNA-binding protein n=1 Tax=Acinetobacter haemolyticus TaxID=29430 RepID=UPI002A6B5536|nr:DNA-binding protein [Acinetobacter haemolyticus]WPO67581.1 DNA-binding protein [Acinetobacter haemolyticus]
MPIKTPEQVRNDFDNAGKTFAEWAISNGFEPQDVYKVLNGQAKAKRGKGHRIAVLLGLKAAPKQTSTVQ